MGCARVGWSCVLGLAFGSACATSRPLQPSASRSPAESAASRRYVDNRLGFEVSPPAGGWQLEAGDEQAQGDGLVTPVVLREKISGAQVLIQIAPSVATPAQLAERLTEGFRRYPGVTSTDPEPLRLGDDAVGFEFGMGEQIRGRVAVLEGNPHQVFLLMATWPPHAPSAVSKGVEQIFDSLKRIPRDERRAETSAVTPATWEEKQL